MPSKPLIFLSTYSSKLDDKHRVSVPSAFRSIIDAQDDSSIVFAYASFVNECIEVCTHDRIAHLETLIDGMDTFSAEKDVMATAILAGCEPLSIDAKGRICLSERLLEFANLQKEVLFVGKGKTFEIWQKEKFDVYYQHSRNIARENHHILRKQA